ncbi:MAG TPA: ATP-dependent zinc metalloprotease FtsH [Acidimicrobiales bacterium]
MTNPRRRIIIIAVVGFAVLALVGWLRSSDEPETLTYSEVIAAVQEGRVVEATIGDRDHEIRGTLTDDTEFESTFVAESGDELVTIFADAGVEVDVDQQKDSFWASLLFTYLPFLLLIGVFLFVMSSMQGGGNRVMQFGKAKTKSPVTDQPRVTFADVAGADEAVEELQEIKEFLEAPAKFQAIGAKIPKGVLLYGPPGTGKTLLARAVAGEAGVPFFSISGSDFVEMFVGVGASRVRDLFEQAKKSAPAIVFVDEIDAVGRHRGAGLGGGHDEREQTLNQLLVEMDGFDVRTGVILIAATNRPDILDPALLRPGRFDRQIVVDRPDLEGRKRILRVHAEGKPLDDEVDLDLVARRSPGFTGADLANLMNEAALLAARRGKDTVGMSEMDDAVDRVIAGPERKSRVMSDDEKRVIAYHEAGHAIVGHALTNTDPIHKVSVIARGRALGWTLALPEADRHLQTRSGLRDELAMLLGGRTAEELIFGDPTTGAANDIERATGIARSMVTEYGMSESLGPQQLGQQQGEVFLGKDMGRQRDYSDEIAARIDAEVRVLLDAAHDEAEAVLAKHRKTLDALAGALMEHETVEGQRLDELLSKVPTWGPRPDDHSPRRLADSNGSFPNGATRRQAKRQPKTKATGRSGRPRR